MFGFDIFSIATVNLDMTADLAPLLFGLCGLVGVSAVGIAVSAVSYWISNTPRAAVIPPATASADLAPQKQPKAA